MTFLQFVCLVAMLAGANAVVVDDHYGHAPLYPIGVQKQIFTPAYAAPAYANTAYTAPVVQKSLATYATPVVQKTVFGHHEHQPYYAYDPNYHHNMPVYSRAYPSVAKAIEYAPATVAKTIEYAPSAVAKTYQYASPIAKTVAYAPVVAKSVAYAPAHYAEPSYAHLAHHHVHPSVSHYGKTVVSPYSHVHKYDTRNSNEHVYGVASGVHDAVAVSAPIVAKAAVAYSPAAAVAHATFQSSDAHYSW